MKIKAERLFSRSEQGFSLIEILITVAVIGILVALCFPAMGKMKDNALKDKDLNNLKQQSTLVFAYAADHDNTLPGRINRGIQIPSMAKDSNRTYYLSTVLIDGGYCPPDDTIWRCPVNYGANDTGAPYVLNSGKSSLPKYFFGNRSNTAGATTYAPQKIVTLKSNIDPAQYSQGKDTQPLNQIWMISNADCDNYSSALAGGVSNAVADNVRTPWGGRNYVFFDGHAEFRKSSDYPSIY